MGGGGGGNQIWEYAIIFIFIFWMRKEGGTSCPAKTVLLFFYIVLTNPFAPKSGNRSAPNVVFF